MNNRPISEMSDREIAEETLELLRLFSELMDSVSSSPMVGAMLGGQNPMLAALKR